MKGSKSRVCLAYFTSHVGMLQHTQHTRWGRLCIGRVFESRGGRPIIAIYFFYLLRFLSHFSLYYLPLLAPFA